MHKSSAVIFELHHWQFGEGWVAQCCWGILLPTVVPWDILRVKAATADR